MWLKRFNSVLTAATSTLKTTRSRFIFRTGPATVHFAAPHVVQLDYTQHVIPPYCLYMPISSVVRLARAVCRLGILVLHLLPFGLHVLCLGLPALGNDRDAQNDHPRNHPAEHDAKVLTKVVLGREDDAL